MGMAVARVGEGKGEGEGSLGRVAARDARGGRWAARSARAARAARAGARARGRTRQAWGEARARARAWLRGRGCEGEAERTAERTAVGELRAVRGHRRLACQIVARHALAWMARVARAGEGRARAMAPTLSCLVNAFVVK